MPAPPEFTTLADLQALITPGRCLDLFDDDGDGAISESESAVKAAKDSANSFVTSAIFRKGFSLAQIEGLTADESLRRYATAIMAQYGGERRTEFLNADGNGRYHAIGQRARDDLKAVASLELRSRLEDDPSVGQNPLAQSETNVGRPVFYFSRDPRYPGRPPPGGF